MIQVHVYVLLSLYGLLFVSLVLCLTLFLSVKREIRRSEGRSRRQQIHLQESYDRIEGGLEALKLTVREVDPTLAVAAQPKSGLNGNKGAQATRMFRNGDRPEQIAAALAIPRSEFNLLLKIQEAASSAFSR